MTKTEASAIRPFHVSFPEAELTELRRRINATSGPSGKRSRMQRKACSSRRFRSSRDYWGDRLRLAQVRGEAEGLAAFHHRDRRAGHSFHSRSFEA